MSAAFDTLRLKAVEAAVIELKNPFTESNNYTAVTDLHLPEGTILENRGERVDEFLITAGARYALTLPGQAGADARMWCGMFIYYCYDKAYKQIGNPKPLPFRGIDLWSGSRLRTWATNYDKGQLQLYNSLTSDPRIANGEMEEIRQQENAKKIDHVILWSNTDKSMNASLIKAQPGDIFSINDGHIGMVYSSLDNGYFTTIEGNQSSVQEKGTAVATHKRTVADCSIIIRI